MPLRTILALGLFTVAVSLQAQSTQESAPSTRPATQPSTHPLVGIWEGVLKVGPSKLRLVLRVRERDGKIEAIVDSPDQGAFGLKVDAVELEGDAVRVKMKEIGAEFSGTLKPAIPEIDGKWKQGLAMPLVLKKVEKPSETKRPQDPLPPYPYREEDVVYSYSPAEGANASTKAGAARDDASRITLAGTLTVPPGDGPHPAALLITGSGQQDRNEFLMGHRPFLVLADHLTRSGFAVLRVDDRGVGGSNGDVLGATSADFAEDVRAGLAFLKARPEIDAKRTGLIGHSEGGLIGPLVAAENPDVAFVVLLAGPGVPGLDIILLQSRLMMAAVGAQKEMIDRHEVLRRDLFTLLAAEKDEKVFAEKARQLIEPIMRDTMPGVGEEMLTQQIDQQIKSVNSPWFRLFITHDPRPILAKLACPVLALNGEKDLQVDAGQNLPEIVTALEAGKCRDYTVAKMKGLNHLFQAASTGSVQEYGMIEETFNRRALEAISAWLAERFAGKERR